MQRNAEKENKKEQKVAFAAIDDILIGYIGIFCQEEQRYMFRAVSEYLYAAGRGRAQPTV